MKTRYIIEESVLRCAVLAPAIDANVSCNRSRHILGFLKIFILMSLR
ncbi:hypothetical protein SAMCFNEI73_pB0354 (plasmid) [Sinorhizobium americanum]|uniref:Uncharacterized protein n=1 Tax=Sinorhizobium americanum TaxID=194963 RepID=A0A1L3LTX9_9HYPH|nr:hypothetical protein SAMCFNEI73_pB0354 [Sinorhizobium americanum]